MSVKARLDLIRHEMAIRDLDGVSLAEESGLCADTIWRMLKGQPVAPATLDAIARAFQRIAPNPGASLAQPPDSVVPLLDGRTTAIAAARRGRRRTQTAATGG